MYRHDVNLVPLAVDGGSLSVPDSGDRRVHGVPGGDDLDLVRVHRVGEEIVQVVQVLPLPAEDEQLSGSL